MSDPTTLLVLTEIGLPFYSARGLTQTLAPIKEATDLRRTVNGELVNVAAAQFKKYSSKISCSDQEPPSADFMMPGTQITVDCVSELWYVSPAVPLRPVVPGSIRNEGGFIFYRPQLLMLVVAFHTSTDEFGAIVAWEIELEEV